MLNCCKITVDRSFGCVMLVVGGLSMLLLGIIGLYEMVCVWLSLGGSLRFCESDNLAIVSKA